MESVIESPLLNLQSGNILIDAGNSFYEDTNRRMARLQGAGLHFIGAGISGGEEGTRNGSSIMPDGSKEAYEQVKPILEAISVKINDTPCSAYMGSDEASYYLKMARNGIEYGDTQLISEAYFIRNPRLAFLP